MTTFKRITGLLVLAACLVAAGCGSDDEGEPIPANTAEELQGRLSEIQDRFDVGAGACGDIENDSRPAVNELIASIPENVDADVRQALREGFDRLFVLSEDQCDQEQQTEPETDTEPAPAPEPEETTTLTVPPETTETTPPPETQTEPTPPDTGEEEIPPGQGGDAPGGGEGGDGESGQGGSGSGPNGAEGGSGGAIVPEGEG